MERARSLQEYISYVVEISKRWDHPSPLTHPWFRGQSNASWPLIPRLYRSMGTSFNPERELVRDFKLRATAFLDQPPTNDLELLFIMQHYGMPTRLIDWTESYLTALFFAVMDDFEDMDAAVWILAPWSLNGAARGGPGTRVPMSSALLFSDYMIPNVDSDPVVREVKAKEPLAVRPSRSTPRIVAQKGMFTVHGCDRSSLDEYAQRPETSFVGLDIVVIEAPVKREVKKDLLLAGVSHSSLFPDLEGLCREIQYRYSEPYLRAKETK